MPKDNARGYAVVRATIALGIIDTIAVVVRFIARKRSRVKVGVDDWMIMASLLPAYAMIIAAALRLFLPLVRLSNQDH